MPERASLLPCILIFMAACSSSSARSADAGGPTHDARADGRPRVDSGERDVSTHPGADGAVQDARAEARASKDAARPDASAPDAAQTCLPSATFDANDPASAGYAVVFSDDFTSLSTIDTSATATAGFKWYLSRFDGTAEPASTISVSATGLDIHPAASTANYNLGSAAPASNAAGYVGQVFGGGGFFEATLSYDPSTVQAEMGFPAFWGEAVEHFANRGADYVPGTDGGFEHFGEDDFFEGDLTAADTWSTALHDWYGVYTAKCVSGPQQGKSGFCNLANTGIGSSYDNYKSSLPDGGVVDWTVAHTVAQLWVPGNASNGGKGYVQNFLDGVPARGGTGAFSPLSKTGWDDVASYDFATLPDSSMVFSILDQDHLIVLLGTGPETPLHVNAVKVWQIPGCSR